MKGRRQESARTPAAPHLFSRVFGLDLRSLAAFRIGIALFVIYDVLSRAVDLTAHYTDAGAMPRFYAAFFFASSAAYHALNPVWLSIYMVTGSAWGTAAIMTLHVLAAILLLIGYRTRLMTLLVWYLEASLQTRNPLVISGADSVAIAFLFFGIFLPLGARYSIDGALNTEKPAGNLYTAPSTVAVYLQFICIYVFTALLKTGAEWRTAGTAIYYALSIDQYVLPAGRLLLHFPALMRTMTLAVWWLELLGSFVFLIPVPLVKLLAVFVFGNLYIGFGATLALGHFPWVNGIVLLLFIPALFWDTAYSWLAKKRPRIEVIYDGDCGFCKKTVAILSEICRPQFIHEAKPAQGKDLSTLRREKSWIVRDASGREYYRFDALALFTAASPLYFWKAPLMRLKPVHAIGDALYRWTAGHRNLLGKLTAPFQFRPRRLRIAWWREAIAVFFIAAVLIYNAAPFLPIQALLDVVNFPVLAARMDQHWMMFAPAPSRDNNGWFVIDGQLRNGAHVDAFRGIDSLRRDKPAAVSGYYPNERWRRYMMNISIRDYKDFRAPLASYLCSDWNEKNSGDRHMDQLSIYFMREQSMPPGEARPIERLRLMDASCR